MTAVLPNAVYEAAEDEYIRTTGACSTLGIGRAIDAALTLARPLIEAEADTANGKRVAQAVELLQRQQIVHRQLISPTHPHVPVLIEVSRVLAVLQGEEGSAQ